MTVIHDALRRFALFLLAAVLATGLAGWRPAGAEEPYDLHVIIPLTGNAAFLGQEEQQFLKLLEGQVNREGGIGGRPLRLVFHDDQTNPQVAVQVADEIIAQHPPIFLGPSIVAECNAIAPLLSDGPVEYCFSPGVHPAPGQQRLLGQHLDPRHDGGPARVLRSQG